MAHDLSKLYQQVIRTHSKQPLHYGKPDHYTHQIEAYNPLCGDSYILYLSIHEENIIEQASFYGHGCALSKASTSVLMKYLQGKNIEAYHELYRLFLLHIEGGSSRTHELFSAFAGVQQFPQRKTCVTLSWEALYQQLG